MAAHSDDEEPTSTHQAHDHGRWAVPYGDLLTVLMALFVVLYAMSTVDQGKYDELAASLAEGFNSTVNVPTDPEVPGDEPEEPEEPLTPQEEAYEELTNLIGLKNAVEADLTSKGLSDGVHYEIDERGLTFKLMGTDMFFDTNQARLTGQANAVISTITPHLTGISNAVSVEGHADERASAYPFETNWDLASARSTTVLRYMNEIGGVPGKRLSATSFGDAHPKVEGSTAEAWAANRRVDLVVLSEASDAARSLIPDMIEKANEAARNP